MVKSFIYGHPVKYINNEWIYMDTKENINNTPLRKCPKCGQFPNQDGYDACFGKLPGVSYACCGHGLGKGYIKFKNGTVIHFQDCDVERKVGITSE